MQRLQLFILVAIGCCCCCCCLSMAAPRAFRALSRQAESGVVAALRSQLGQLASPLPGGAVCPACLMVAPQASSQLVQGSVPLSQLQAGIRSHGLPQEVADRLSALAFARSVTFHTFAFTVSTLVGRGHYETYIGAGRRLDNVNVEFGVIRSVAGAQLVAKSTPVPRRNCKRRFFIKRCHSWTEQVPRGLTAEELRLVEAALRHFAIASAASRLTVLRSRRSLELADEMEDAKTTAAPTASTVAPDNRSAADNGTLIELVRTGFDRLAVSATTQTLRRIPVSMVTRFASVFARSLRLPKSLVGPVKDAVLDAASSPGGPRHLSVLFNGEDSPAAIRFIQLALTPRSGSFDLTSASVRLEVRLADRLQLLVSQDGDGGDGDIRVRRLPARVGPEELRQVLRLLRAAAEGRLSRKPLLRPSQQQADDDF